MKLRILTGLGFALVAGALCSCGSDGTPVDTNVGATAQAAALKQPPWVKPAKIDLFYLDGGNLHVVYTPTADDGRPLFYYEEFFQTGLHKQLFRGSEIQTVATEAGTLVSVHIRRAATTPSAVGVKDAVLFQTNFSVLIPGVQVGGTEVLQVKTVGITNVHRFVSVPLDEAMQLDEYGVTGLHGTAARVDVSAIEPWVVGDNSSVTGGSGRGGRPGRI